MNDAVDPCANRDSIADGAYTGGGVVAVVAVVAKVREKERRG